jgi:hypothetical protein
LFRAGPPHRETRSSYRKGPFATTPDRSTPATRNAVLPRTPAIGTRRTAPEAPATMLTPALEFGLELELEPVLPGRLVVSDEPA